MEMATHSSILAWRIPWTVACQAPLSMGSSTCLYIVCGTFLVATQNCMVAKPKLSTVWPFIKNAFQHQLSGTGVCCVDWKCLLHLGAWENVEAQAPLWIHWIRIYILTIPHVMCMCEKLELCLSTLACRRIPLRVCDVSIPESHSEEENWVRPEGLNFFFLTEVQLIYNISGVQQSDSVMSMWRYIHTHTFPLNVTIRYWIQFPVLYSRSFLLIHSSMYLLISTPNLFLHSFPFVNFSLFSVPEPLCFENKCMLVSFFRLYIWAMSYICLCLTYFTWCVNFT